MNCGWERNQQSTICTWLILLLCPHIPAEKRKKMDSKAVIPPWIWWWWTLPNLHSQRSQRNRVKRCSIPRKKSDGCRNTIKLLMKDIAHKDQIEEEGTPDEQKIDTEVKLAIKFKDSQKLRIRNWEQNRRHQKGWRKLSTDIWQKIKRFIDSKEAQTSWRLRHDSTVHQSRDCGFCDLPRCLLIRSGNSVKWTVKSLLSKKIRPAFWQFFQCNAMHQWQFRASVLSDSRRILMALSTSTKED